ncbi:MAG: SGNH/GDSL hydrolase family protein [Acidobacteria bacterium]|nr:SGNH/GDSL hydrolase family protein [Acidobacteriota bacterium]
MWKRFKNLTIGVMLSVLSVLLTICAGEVLFRLYRRWEGTVRASQVKSQELMTHLRPLTLDNYLGWRATENYQFAGTKKSADGTEYPINISQDEHGFRIFGNVHSRKPRILVIGDSFTQAMDASDDKTYYGTMRDTLDVEVFAYGGGGYGTLQEFMILDEYIDLIKPDLILWQYCTNDFINNSPELETASWQNNNSMVRPYWVDGKIVYILPKFGGKIRSFAVTHSKLLNFITTRVDKVLANRLESVESDVEREGFKYPGFAESVQVTDALMAAVRNRAGAIPVVAFSATAAQPYDEVFKTICAHNGIPLLVDVVPAIRAAESRGIVVRAEDGGHWNETGHRIAGEVIAAQLKSMNLYTSQGPVHSQEVRK